MVIKIICQGRNESETRIKGKNRKMRSDGGNVWIEKLVVYETEREYQGTFIDSNFVSGDCGAGGPGRVKEKSKGSKLLYCGDCGPTSH